MAGISNADPGADPTRPRRSSAVGSCRCRTSSRLPSASSEPELELCDQLGIAFLPWSPLGGISAAGRLGDAAARSPRSRMPTASARKVVVLAWQLAKSPQRGARSPVPSRPETIRDSAAATELELTADEIARSKVTGRHEGVEPGRRSGTAVAVTGAMFEKRRQPGSRAPSRSLTAEPSDQVATVERNG